ncbi:MAG: 3-oxoacyl-ACP reductase family protein [Thermoleophilia bacterium]
MAGKKLEGKAALITGAGRGIGREIARLFAENGADLCVNYLRSRDAAESLAEQCRGYGSRALVVQADVSKVDPARNLVETALAEFGKIDILVNNAGVLTQALVQDMSVETWDAMIASDLRSVFLCTRFALPSMIERRYGRIINVASQLGQKGAPELGHYCAAKAGVIGFTKALAREVGAYGITANCLAPGPIDTDMVAGISESWKDMKRKELPIPRFGRVEEVAPAALLLAADPDGSIFTGQTLGPNSGDVML